MTRLERFARSPLASILAMIAGALTVTAIMVSLGAWVMTHLPSMPPPSPSDCAQVERVGEVCRVEFVDASCFVFARSISCVPSSRGVE